MPDAPRVHVSAMEGKGAYNRNAAIPASGGAFAIPLLEKAAQQISLNSDDRPIVIADYGSSQEKTRSRPHVLQLQPFECAPVGNGRFSCATPTSQPMTSAKCLRCSRATRKAICKANRRFFHMRSAALLSEAVPARLRRSRVEFLRRRLAHQIPVQIPDHFFIPCSTGSVRAEFDRQAARDWELFLTLRAAELRAGGRLVVALPALDHDGTVGFASMRTTRTPNSLSWSLPARLLPMSAGA
jgi:hypothetical protein